MLTNYKEKCKNLVKSHIERNTRHKLGKFTLEDYQEFVADFQVEVVNKFGVSYDETTHKGSTDKGDEKYFQQAEYKNAIKRHINQEFNDEQNFKYMLDEISKGSYGKYKIKQSILRGNTILYEYNCPNCKGHGEVRCDKCRNGEIVCNASGCKNGRVEKSRQVNGKKRIYYETCTKCRGKGRIVCPKCDGSALIDCSNCDAEGTLTDKASIFMTTKPNYKILCPENMDKEIQNAIHEYSASNLNAITDITRATLQHSTSQKIVTEIYGAKIPFAKFNVVCDGKKFAWCVYGTNLQILRDDNMLNYFLQSDINSLVEISKKISYFDTKILKKSQATVANFMKSKINQQIIETDITTCKIYKSLSRDYLENTFKSFEKMAKSFCNGITLNYFIIAFVISFIIAFIISKYGFLASIAIFPLFLYLSNRHKKSAFKKWWGDTLLAWAESAKFIKTKFVLWTIIGTACVFAASYYANLDKLTQIYNNGEISEKPKQESVTQSVEKPTKTQTAEPQTTTPTAEKPAEPQIQSETNTPSEPSVDYEQKFGKRIYLATKDDFVNMRKAPNGEIITQIYKKDFADIMVFSFDTNSNEKWLKVVYFPPNSKDEKDAILGYIHISQIDKSGF